MNVKPSPDSGAPAVTTREDLEKLTTEQLQSRVTLNHHGSREDMIKRILSLLCGDHATAPASAKQVQPHAERKSAPKDTPRPSYEWASPNKPAPKADHVGPGVVLNDKEGVATRRTPQGPRLNLHAPQLPVSDRV